MCLVACRTDRDSRRCMVTSLTDVCVLVASRTERDSRRCMVTILTDVCVLVAWRTERDGRRCMVTSLTDVHRRRPYLLTRCIDVGARATRIIPRFHLAPTHGPLRRPSSQYTSHSSPTISTSQSFTDPWCIWRYM